MGSTQTRIAAPVKVIAAQPPQAALAEIGRLAQDYQAGGIVVGWPLNMDDGSEGPQADLARELARQIVQTTGLDVRLWDERLSSFTADQSLAGHLTRKKRRARQDAIAAAAILQDFLMSDGADRAIRP